MMQYGLAYIALGNRFAGERPLRASRQPSASSGGQGAEGTIASMPPDGVAGHTGKPPGPGI